VSEATRLATLFKVLGSTTRVRVLHVLVTNGETRAGDIARSVAMTPQAVSNQLRRLADLEIVAARRVGAEVYYQAINPCVPSLLDKGLCFVRKRC
jgi:DNA-binding transcriptional ArsR family regulator